MSLLKPVLLQKLGRTRLQAHHAVASAGVGERRSRARGAGIEFADHRPYGLGDDIRHLDRHVHARLGEHHVKQFSVYQQLPVTILLDTSASMAYGQPQKSTFAASLAAGLAYVGLAGGDRVLVGAFAKGRVQWHPRVHGVRRMGALHGWLERQRFGGSTDLAKTVRSAMPRLSGEGLTILISDWMVEGVDEALATLSAARQEVVGIHLLAPEELEPERLGSGEVRFIDSEGGSEVETSLDANLLQRYRSELEVWSLDLKGQLQARQGRYFRVRSDDELEQLFLRDWRIAGLIA